MTWPVSSRSVFLLTSFLCTFGMPFGKMSSGGARSFGFGVCCCKHALYVQHCILLSIVNAISLLFLFECLVSGRCPRRCPGASPPRWPAPPASAARTSSGPAIRLLLTASGRGRDKWGRHRNIFPRILSQAILAGIILVGRSGAEGSEVSCRRFTWFRRMCFFVVDVCVMPSLFTKVGHVVALTRRVRVATPPT